MPIHPYQALPDSSFWKRSVAGISFDEVDPVVGAKFKIGATDRVVTAGSCFAQHIARHLQSEGFNYFVAEPPHPIVPPDIARRNGYGVFSARYGNVYTARQLVQLIRRAYNEFQPSEDCWIQPDGRLIDPFRPQIQEGGFASVAEFKADRHQHFRAVRKAIEELDVFVFTLGLTEAWSSRSDGAVFPLCPGVVGGEFDPGKHRFQNFRVLDVVGDLAEAVRIIRGKNARARFLLTVSPVPLIATAEPTNVLVATTYSKSVLRVAAQEVADASDFVAYFPSYEIITGGHTQGRYFGPDLRDVTDAGVARVMSLFMKHYTDKSGASSSSPVSTSPSLDHRTQEIARITAVLCDEEALDRSASPRAVS